MTRVIGYIRCSTKDQADSHLGLKAQRSAISAEASRRGWKVLWVEDSAQSAKSLDRDGLQEALKMLRSGRATAILVAKLDRLSRSVVDFGELLQLAKSQSWSLIALDLGVDTTTPAGELIANVMVAVAQWERQIIGQRTKDALSELKAQGIRLGRPSVVSPEALDLIRGLAGRASFNSISRTLMQEGCKAPSGGEIWYGSTVAAIIRGLSAA